MNGLRDGNRVGAASTKKAMRAARPGTSFLRIPPFPHARELSLSRPGRAGPPADSEASVDRLIEAVGRLRVGGTYWGARPPLPTPPFSLVAIDDDESRSRILETISPDRHVVCWTRRKAILPRIPGRAMTTVSGDCDPWHLVGGAEEVFADTGDLALVAAISEIPVAEIGSSIEDPRRTSRDSLCRTFQAHVVDGIDYIDPYTGEPLDVADAIELCSFWKRLIESNRDLSAAIGFALWKRPTVAPLLWGGGAAVPFNSKPAKVAAGDSVAVWRSRAPASAIAELERKGAQMVEVEDGFIRSVGLGAECVPPLSIVVDRLGPHFDPSQPSELEQLLQDGDFGEELLDRAAALRGLIVAGGVSKYGAGAAPIEQRRASRKHVLVPGQVEDDRSVLCGGGPVSTNLDLLNRVRRDAPDAYILYKPHPDVEAAHRVGAIPDNLCLGVADEIVRDVPITALIPLADEVHVNTSLAGFEALLRGKVVVTHGVPFYAGWGLTRDLGEVPARRTRRRSLDELTAAVLLLYPRYLDPVTGLPCPPEILIRRLAEPRPSDGALIQLRRLQGKMKQRLATWRPR